MPTTPLFPSARAGSTAAAAVIAAPAAASTSEQRWDAWQAKGIAHDSASRRKLRIGGSILAAIAAAVFYALVGR